MTTKARKKPGPKPGKKKAGRPAAAGRRRAKADPPPAAPQAAEVPLNLIDLSVCDRVRAKVNPERVERYRQRYADGKPMDPVLLFATRGADGIDPAQPVWCGDGGHRVRAKRVSDSGATITALVSLHPTPEAAYRAAWACAAPANEGHGLTRSGSDVRAAVRAVLQELPDLAAGSDRSVSEFCDCHRIVVRKARKELTAEGVLTGKASADGRYTGDEPDDPPAAPAPHADRTPAKTERREAVAPPATTRAPEPEEPGEAPALVNDHFGRPVPDTLAATFLAAPRVRAAYASLAQVGEELRRAVGVGVGTPDSLNTASLEGLMHDLRGCEPWAVCPACDGRGRQGRQACPACAAPGAADGTGWHSRRQFDRLTADQQEVCRGPWG